MGRLLQLLGPAVQTASLQLLPSNASLQGLAPSLLDLAQQSGEYDTVRQHCRQLQDLLGFTAALIKTQRA